jgi:hypothetical protein
VGLLSPPVAIHAVPRVILTDPIKRWGPVSVLTARPTRATAILVEYHTGLTPAMFRCPEPRC